MAHTETGFVGAPPPCLDSCQPQFGDFLPTHSQTSSSLAFWKAIISFCAITFLPVKRLQTSILKRCLSMPMTLNHSMFLLCHELTFLLSPFATPQTTQTNFGRVVKTGATNYRIGAGITPSSNKLWICSMASEGSTSTGSRHRGENFTQRPFDQRNSSAPESCCTNSRLSGAG